MKTRTYIKPNSYTQKACNANNEVVRRITEAAGIDKDTWLNILFESGCNVIESNIEDNKMQASLLQNVRFGFWAWWIYCFIDDDMRMLREFPPAYIREFYHELKMEMVQLVTVDKDSDFFFKETIEDIWLR